MAEFNVTINQLTSKADELEQLNATFDSMIKTLQETEAALYQRAAPGDRQIYRGRE